MTLPAFLPLLLACGAPAPSGNSTVEVANLRGLEANAPVLAELELTAWQSGVAVASLRPAELKPGSYTLRVFDYGSCALVREKEANPLLGSKPGRSVLPTTAQAKVEVGSGPVETSLPVAALKRNIEALERRPVALIAEDGRYVACGELASARTAKN